MQLNALIIMRNILFSAYLETAEYVHQAEFPNTKYCRGRKVLETKY